ncbi:hypothetical protein SCWH03_26550 [Streptomyces pacificus]|uniref:Uncharacterized protein n=1 Tax=Streptomyces pacificus TaxID=2705029 RepID=A0A6A0AXV9_9ACTN|nr:hypothetical protein SCWH03_26550 [Streptomyces pacificus]
MLFRTAICSVTIRHPAGNSEGRGFLRPHPNEVPVRILLPDRFASAGGNRSIGPVPEAARPGNRAGPTTRAGMNDGMNDGINDGMNGVTSRPC